MLNIKELANKYYIDFTNDSFLHYQNFIVSLFNDIVDMPNVENIYDISDPIICYILGLYHEKKKNYDIMKKYYMIAIELKHTDAMISLGLYYHTIEHNTENAKKYFNLALSLGNNDALDCYEIMRADIESDLDEITSEKNNIQKNYDAILKKYDYINKTYNDLCSDLNNICK
jgi:TPR repeat protein